MRVNLLNCCFTHPDEQLIEKGAEEMSAEISTDCKNIFHTHTTIFSAGVKILRDSVTSLDVYLFTSAEPIRDVTA